MKLFLFGNRPNVIERWNEILVSEHPQVLTVSELNNEKISEGDVLIVHLSSISVELSEQILRLKDKAPTIQIVCASDAPEEMEGIRVLQAGANGYINSYITASLLLEVLSTVHRGDIWAGPELLQKLLKRLLIQPQPSVPEIEPDSIVESLESLSSREHEVLSVLVSGVSNKEIARKLEITERTVKAHLSSIFQKTGASDRISLILRAKNHI